MVRGKPNAYVTVTLIGPARSYIGALVWSVYRIAVIDLCHLLKPTLKPIECEQGKLGISQNMTSLLGVPSPMPWFIADIRY